MKASTDTEFAAFVGHRLGGPQARRVSAGGRLEQARAERAARIDPRRSTSGPRGCVSASAGGRLPCAWRSPRGRWCMPCSATRSWCCSRSIPTTLAKYRKTFCVSGAKDDPSDAAARPGAAADPSGEAHPPRPRARPDAHAAAAGRAAPHAGRRRAPDHQPHHRTRSSSTSLRCWTGSRTRTRWCSATSSPAGRR